MTVRDPIKTLISLYNFFRQKFPNPPFPAAWLDNVDNFARCPLWMIDSIWGGKVMMRPQDHQAIQDVHILAHTDENIVFDLDNSGYGLLVESSVAMASADSATSCEMKRP